VQVFLRILEKIAGVIIFSYIFAGSERKNDTSHKEFYRKKNIMACVSS
jgi:hypothetical protein